MSSVREAPIGVFDSGVGGLTVVRDLLRELPHESVVYVGDTARVPYGPRGAATITRFALELVQFLLARQVKAVVIACNTVSAIAADAIREVSPVPVLDVVAPTVRAAVEATRSGQIGLIGTVSTVRSGIYHSLAQQLRPDAGVQGVACPLFVPIAEESLTGHPVAHLMAREYLDGFRGSEVDTLILGCTHYPLLRSVVSDVIQEVTGRSVTLVDSARPTVADLVRELDARHLRAAGPPQHEFCVTDASYKFLQIANSILERDISSHVRQVTL